MPDQLLKRQSLFALVLIAVVGSLSFAQRQTSPDVDVVRITTNLVQVDVVVTDQSGRPVTDLKPEELKLFEDTRERKITNFLYVPGDKSPSPARPVTANNNPPPLPPDRLRPDDVRRTIALVVDDLGLSFESTHFVRRALCLRATTSFRWLCVTSLPLISIPLPRAG